VDKDDRFNARMDEQDTRNAKNDVARDE